MRTTLVGLLALGLLACVHRPADPVPAVAPPPAATAPEAAASAPAIRGPVTVHGEARGVRLYVWITDEDGREVDALLIARPRNDAALLIRRAQGELADDTQIALPDHPLLAGATIHSGALALELAAPTATIESLGDDQRTGRHRVTLAPQACNGCVLDNAQCGAWHAEPCRDEQATCDRFHLCDPGCCA